MSTQGSETISWAHIEASVRADEQAVIDAELKKRADIEALKEQRDLEFAKQICLQRANLQGEFEQYQVGPLLEAFNRERWGGEGRVIPAKVPRNAISCGLTLASAPFTVIRTLMRPDNFINIEEGRVRLHVTATDDLRGTAAGDPARLVKVALEGVCHVNGVATTPDFFTKEIKQGGGREAFNSMTFTCQLYNPPDDGKNELVYEVGRLGEHPKRSDVVNGIRTLLVGQADRLKDYGMPDEIRSHTGRILAILPLKLKEEGSLTQREVEDWIDNVMERNAVYLLGRAIKRLIEIG